MIFIQLNQAEAALFAAGCLCELSPHYAQIALEKVVEMANAMGSSPALKLSAIRVFSKLGASPHLALQAHGVCAFTLTLKLPATYLTIKDQGSPFVCMYFVLCSEIIEEIPCNFKQLVGDRNRSIMIVLIIITVHECGTLYLVEIMQRPKCSRILEGGYEINVDGSALWIKLEIG